MNIMLEYKQISAFVDIIFNKTCPESVSELRLYALRRLNGITAQYLRAEILPSLVETIWDKKWNFIKEATTNAEITSILKPSLPRYSCGRWFPSSQYHVEAEELLFWAIASPHNKLINAAQERYTTLFIKCLPDVAKKFGLIEK